MIKFGDENISFGGIYDESDGYDATPGSMSICKNMIPNRNKSSLINRGGFSKYVDPPSTSNGGLTTGLSIYKVLKTIQYKITQPTEKLITLMCAVCTFTPTGGSAVYMLRFFMNPPYTGSTTALYPTGGSFGASTDWRDVTPYYIDIVETNKTIVNVAGTAYYCPITAPSNGGYHSGDLGGAYIYIEDAANWVTATGGQHLAEGNKLTTAADLYVDMATNRFYFNATSSKGAINGTDIVKAGQDIVRFHKNLALGKLEYQSLCSTSSTFFDAYTITPFSIDENQCLSVHPGNTGRPGFTLSFNYINKKLFGTGNLFSRMDYAYAASTSFFDKHLVYGFPGYENINKTDSTNVFNGATVSRWAAGVSPSTAAATHTAGAYTEITGRITCGTMVLTTNNLYRIASTDNSIYVNDFIMSEFDLHGRYGQRKDFSTATVNLSSYITYNRNYKFYNFSEFAVDNADGIGYIATTETLFSDPLFRVLLVAGYNNFRFGLHSECSHSLSTGTATNILTLIPQIPVSFNRNITNICFIITDDKAASGASGIDAITATDVKAAKTYFIDEINDTSQYDLHLCLVTNTGALSNDPDFFYTRVYRYDANKFSNSSVAGNHVVLTGNPDYVKLTSTASTEQEAYLTSNSLSNDISPRSRMLKDMSFGFKHVIIARDRLYGAGAVYQEYQLGTISGRQYSDNRVIFFTPIAQFGGAYHPYADNTTQLVNRDSTSPITGLTLVAYAQGLDDSIQKNSTNLLVVYENGYLFIDLTDNDPGGANVATYRGDACVGSLSVHSEGGVAFYGGNSGVYMFGGQKQIDITSLGGSKINKTWRAVTRANKQKAIGCYNKDRKQYWLGVGGTIYVFDFELENIYIYDVSGAFTFDERSTMFFIDNTMYCNVLSTGGSQILVKYDETITQDWNGSTDVNFTTQIRLNNIKTERWGKLNSFGVTYSSGANVTISPIIDYTGVGTPGATLTYSNTESSGTDIFVERKTKRLFNSRGRRFSIDISTASGSLEVMEIQLNVTENIPQKRLGKGYVYNDTTV